jgi:hypothetical protein
MTIPLPLIIYFTQWFTMAFITGKILFPLAAAYIWHQLYYYVFSVALIPLPTDPNYLEGYAALTTVIAIILGYFSMQWVMDVRGIADVDWMPTKLVTLTLVQLCALLFDCVYIWAYMKFESPHIWVGVTCAVLLKGLILVVSYFAVYRIVQTELHLETQHSELHGRLEMKTGVRHPGTVYDIYVFLGVVLTFSLLCPLLEYISTASPSFTFFDPPLGEFYQVLVASGFVIIYCCIVYFAIGKRPIPPHKNKF